MAHATVGESGLFSFDTRDSVSTVVAESAVFAFDTRQVDGLSGTNASSNFITDTRNMLGTAVVLSGPNVVLTGSQTSYQVLLTGTAIPAINVTNAATLHFATVPLKGVGIGGLDLFVSKDALPQTVYLQAIYQNGSGLITSPALAIGISQGFTALLTSSTVSTGINNYQVTLTGSTSGATGTMNYRWDTNGDGVYGDQIGQTVNYALTSQGGTYPVKLEVTNTNDLKAYATGRIVVDKAPVTAQQPRRVKPYGDVGGGAQVYDHEGHLFQFDTGRADKGLIVVTHGLYATGLDFWSRDLTQRINSRLGANAPNIMIYDWGRDSDPSGDIDPVRLGLLEGLGKIYSIITPKQAIKAGLRPFFGKGADLLLGNPADAAKALDFAIDCYYIRPIGQSHGTILASWLWLQANAGLINPDRPIHLIGHSAGGFCLAECALYLRQHALTNGKILQVDRVTMLDTPFPIASHFTQLPSPTVVERVVSSFYGGLEFPGSLTIPTGSYTPIRWLGAWWTRFGQGDSGHGLSHVWYRRTVQPGGETNASDLDSYGTNGFALSPFAGGYTIVRSESMVSMQLPPGKASIVGGLEAALETVSQFATFGNVTAMGTTYRLTESADAGIYKTVNIPIGAQALRFRYQFISAGDGDFISIRFGDQPDLYLGLDTAITRDGFTTVDVPLDGMAGETGELVISLVSRGTINAVADVADIEFVTSEDPDGDGLTTTQETTMGTNPLAFDSDNDGLSDLEEVNGTPLTSPLLPDSDFDGSTDSQEQVAGTNPMDASSRFQVVQVQKTGTNFLLRWSGVAGKIYQIQRSDHPSFGSFTTVASGLAGIVPLTTYTDAALGAPVPNHLFYRVQVEQ